MNITRSNSPADDRVLEFEYTVVFKRGAEGGFIASIPAFDWLTIHGNTLPEARRMAGQAIGDCLNALMRQGAEIPAELNSSHIESIAVRL